MKNMKKVKHLLISLLRTLSVPVLALAMLWLLVHFPAAFWLASLLCLLYCFFEGPEHRTA